MWWGEYQARRMTNLVYRFATVQGQHVQWFLRRNCSVTPRQLFWVFLSLCAISLGIGTFFWMKGATLVLPFASLELLAVAVAFVVYARHATDGERILLRGTQLVVEFENGGKLERAEFQREVAAGDEDGSGGLRRVPPEPVQHDVLDELREDGATKYSAVRHNSKVPVRRFSAA